MGYRKEGEFPFRPDHMHFHDLDHLTVNEMKTMEHRIKAAIDMGGIINDNGKYVSINDTTGINTLGQIIESSACSPNAHYYGSLHNLAHVMLSKVSDPQGNTDFLQVLWNISKLPPEIPPSSDSTNIWTTSSRHTRTACHLTPMKSWTSLVLK